MAVVHSVKYGHLGLPCGKFRMTALRLGNVGEHCDFLGDVHKNIKKSRAKPQKKKKHNTEKSIQEIGKRGEERRQMTDNGGRRT